MTNLKISKRNRYILWNEWVHKCCLEHPILLLHLTVHPQHDLASHGSQLWQKNQTA